MPGVEHPASETHPAKNSQVPCQQRHAWRFGLARGRPEAGRCLLSEVRSSPPRVCKMQCELPGGSARCKILPVATSILLRVDQSERRWDVCLSNGISAASKRVAITACI